METFNNLNDLDNEIDKANKELSALKIEIKSLEMDRFNVINERFKFCFCFGGEAKRKRKDEMKRLLKWEKKQNKTLMEIIESEVCFNEMFSLVKERINKMESVYKIKMVSFKEKELVEQVKSLGYTVEKKER